MVVGRIQSSRAIGLRSPLFLSGCWLEAVLSSLPCGPLHRAAHNMVAGFHQSKQTGQRERIRQRMVEDRVFLSLISDVILHHFCQILCIRSKSLDSAHTQSKGIKTRSQLSGSPGTPFKSQLMPELCYFTSQSSPHSRM